MALLLRRKKLDLPYRSPMRDRHPQNPTPVPWCWPKPVGSYSHLSKTSNWLRWTGLQVLTSAKSLLLNEVTANSFLCYLTGCDCFDEFIHLPYNQVQQAQLLKALATHPWEVVRFLQMRSQTDPTAILIILAHAERVNPSLTALLTLMQLLHNLNACMLFIKQILSAMTLPRLHWTARTMPYHL